MKKILILILVAALVLALVGCGGTASPNYDWAVLTLPNGVTVEGAVGSTILCYETGVVVEIDGVIYRVHPSDIVLIDNRED